MTTETTAFMIGYGFFLLITALLVFAWKKDQKLCQELLKENNELTEAKENAIKSIYNSRAEVESIGIDLIQLRRDFIEQSELATSWRQKHDRLEIDYAHLRDESASVQNLNNEFHAEILNLESELDRGNEMITWMKADLEKAHELNRKNEMAIMDLLIKGKFPDEKGVYRKNYLSKNGENLPLGEYIDSLYCSKVVETNLDTKRKLVALSKETITVDDFLKSPDLATGHMKSVIEIKPEQPLADAIDWNVPQAFPMGYEVPLGIRVMALEDRPTGIRAGWKGITVNGLLTTPSIYPFVKWDIEDFNNGYACALQSSHLAPINPTDHPLHPEFGKEKFSLDVTKQDIENANPPAVAVNDFKLP
jgi:hypothetical protein